MIKIAFGNTPEEILFLIFQHLSGSSLYECQKVCRLWYRPAHLLFLKSITFYGLTDVVDFLNAINYNPQPSYLSAVKCFTFTGIDSSLLDANVSNQLLSRFPNLESIYGTIPFRIVSAKFYESLVETCPRLKSVALSDGFQSPTYNEFLYNLRGLLTKVKIGEIYDLDDYVYLAGGLRNFITSFPLLRELDVFDVGEFYGFTKCLQLFELLPHLEVLKCGIGDGEDEDDMVNEFLVRRRTNRAELMERFSKLKRLYIISINPLSLGLIRFVNNYLTGLEHLEVMTFFNDNWADIHNTYYLEFLKRICLLSTFDISTKMQKDSVIKACLFPIIFNTFYREPTNVRIVNKVLHVSLFQGSPFDPSEKVYTIEAISKKTANVNQITRAVRLSLFSEALEGVGMIQKLSSLRSVNIFKFVRRMASPQKLYFAILVPILAQLPNVTKLTLEIPPVINDSNFEPMTQFTNISHLQLKVYNVMKISTELSFYSHRFPSVKYLTLSGTWASTALSHQVSLKMAKLERLDLDVASVQVESEDHFLLKVDILSEQKSYVYRISFDGLLVTEVSGDNLKVKVHVTLFDLKCLRLYLFNDEEKKAFTGIPYIEDEFEDTVETKILF